LSSKIIKKTVKIICHISKLKYKKFVWYRLSNPTVVLSHRWVWELHHWNENS